ncbi:MAG: MarR family winged helix-turn-helix transcriptional regulator [Caldimonas sp.]
MVVAARSRSNPPPVDVPVSPRGCSSQKVRRLSRRISQHFDRVVAGSGLKTTQYSLLSHVVQLGPIRPGELARAMDLDASTLTRNLQLLVVAGWVVVGPGEDDRSRMVSATDAGRVKRAEAQRAWKRAQLAFNERVGAEAVARLHAAVEECLTLLGDSED